MKDLEREVIVLARKVAEYIREERVNFSRGDVRFKSVSKQDLVSHVDEGAEERLLEGLSKLEPAAAFISEEGNPDYKKGLNWVVDPVDGTTNFVHDIPHYAISIALADGDDILLGVVLEVTSDACFHSTKGERSCLNDQPISVSSNNDLKAALLSTGFSVKNHDRLDENLRLLKYWVEHSRGIRRLGSAALDLCYVAKGTFDIYYETGLKAWDVAAGTLIVQNAGGKVSDFEGNTNYLYGAEIVASNGYLHATAQSQILSVSGTGF